MDKVKMCILKHLEVVLPCEECKEFDNQKGICEHWKKAKKLITENALISLEEVNEVIDKELNYAFHANPQMAMGMLQIKKLLGGIKND